MPNKKGGYQIVDVLALTYALALEYLNCGKPLLVVDGTNHPFFADSVTLNADDEVVIQKGGYTITIDDEDNITTDGSIPVSGGGDSGLKLYVHSFTITTDQYPFTSLKVISKTSSAYANMNDLLDDYSNIVKVLVLQSGGYSAMGLLGETIGDTPIHISCWGGNDTSWLTDELTAIGTDTVTEF